MRLCPEMSDPAHVSPNSVLEGPKGPSTNIWAPKVYSIQSLGPFNKLEAGTHARESRRSTALGWRSSNRSFVHHGASGRMTA